MLGIHRLTSGGADYYLNDLAQELPLAADQWKGRAEWTGQAAFRLGLIGPVVPEQLRLVLDGREPGAGRRLRSERATNFGFDLTFSAPKSVSVLYGLGGEEVARQVVRSHREAVLGAVAYLETHGVTAQRRSGDERAVLGTTGMVATSFTHGVNRNLDPHLHTHVVMANMVHGVDGRWSSVDQRGLWAHREAARSVYEAHLRADLSSTLGVSWESGRGLSAEVSGVSPVLRGEFSSRSADIRLQLSQWGAHSKRGADLAWAVTRPAKTTGLSFNDLKKDWERRADAVGEAGIAPDTFRGRGRGAGDGQATTLNEYRFSASLSTTSDGAVRRRDVIAGLGVAAVGGATAPALERMTDLWIPPSRHVGVAEEVHAPRKVVPSRHLIAALGPRPVDPKHHEVWRDGARAIEDYRQRWGLRGSEEPLGVAAGGQSLSSLPAPRLADHVRTTRTIEIARQRLGRTEPRAMEIDRGR